MENKNMDVREIVYFAQMDRQNTDVMVNIAKKRVDELGIKSVVMAWSSGYTVRKFLKIAKGEKLNLVAVTNPKGGHLDIVIMPTDTEHQKQWKEAQLKRGVTTFPVSITDENREKLEKQGVKVCYLEPDYFNLKTTWNLQEDFKLARAKLATFGFAAHLDLTDVNVGADLTPLNMMGQGFRISVAMAILAAQAGLVAEGETVATLAGIATALILKVSSNPRNCFVKEILGFDRNPGGML
jgi:hypothetical protein